ncbi:MAG: hypothetical protein ACLGI6_05255 [Gammaproteobacteria bacterium]
METKKPQGSLTRAEHMKEEARLAAEFGQTPKRPASVARNFRTEGLTRLTPPAVVLRGEVKEIMKVAPPAAPRVGNDFADKSRGGAVLAAIEDLLKRMDDSNRALLVPQLLDYYGNFAAHATNDEQLKALQVRVLTAAFGEQFFTQSKGGSAVDQDALTKQSTI